MSGLVRKSKKNPKFLKEIHFKEQQLETKEIAISVVLEEMVKEDAFIDSSDSVISRLG